MRKRRQQNPGKDFEKKKRKVGKGKIVPSNTTNTSFVSHGISVPAQLVVKSEHVPTTKRKLSFTELLSQLHHHNANFRHDSLTGLRELFTSHPVILTTNLSVLLEKISPVFTDSSSVVRQALLSLLKHIIENVKKSNLVLFFPRLVTCVMCAMTHIDSTIQLDSLRYLQLFLMDCSDLLVKNAPKLPNFYLSLLTLQSNVIDIAKSDSVIFKPESGSTSTNKLVPMKTRLKIFTQLSQLLKASIDCATVDKNDNDFSYTQVVPGFDVVNRKEINSDHSLEGHCVHFFDLSKSIPSVKLVKNWGTCPPVNAFIKDGSVKDMQNRHYLFSCFIAKLLPILFECWMESGPMHMLSGSFTSTELDMKIAVMKLLLYIIQLAHVYSGDNGMSQLRTLYSNQFQKCFLTYFPFKNLLKSEYIFMLNLYLCEITIKLYGGICNNNFGTLMLNFFRETLPHEFYLFTDNPSVTNDCMLCFTRCLRSVIISNNENSSTAVAAMVEGGICFYDNCHVQSQAKKYLIQIFYELMVVQEKMWKASESDDISTVLVSWLNNLPKLLRNLGCTNLETSSLIFDVLGHAAARNMMSMVEAQAEQLFDEPSFISALPEELQRKAVSLVWHLPLLNSDTLKSITRLILWDTLKLEIAVHLMQIVNERLLVEYRTAENEICSTDKCPLHIVSLYLFFFWSIITFGNNTSDCDEIDTSNSYKYIVMDKILSGSADKVQSMCKCILASDFSDQVWDLVSRKMDCLLSHKYIPVSTALGVLWFTIGINKTIPLMDSSSCFHSIVTLLLRLVIYVYTEEDDTSVPQQVVITLLLDVENLLPALLHNVVADLNNGGVLLPSILVKLLKETQLTHLFYKHRDILTAIINNCNALQWRCDLYKEVIKFYEKQ